MPDDGFLIIGHRGAAGLEPENTLRSFARALEIGVDAIELDVYCVEGHLVVIHDDTLERTTNGHGEVMQTSFAALRRLDAGRGERIPTLAEVFAVVPNGFTVNVELKGKGTAEPVARCIAEHAHVDALVSSFDHAELTRFHHVAPKARTAPLFHRASTRMFDIAAALEAWSINLSEKLATAERLAGIGDRGYRSLVYTVNDPAVAERLRSAGATGIFTDYPDRMRRFRS
ncbi:MAG TPA: glycerophosphodiester phosphodiesterase family protein [Pseudomonadales bacterium]|nr:glycerophosphodiester phosphodiesterase family protein [Pseudomonadales bacterium]